MTQGYKYYLCESRELPQIGEKLRQYKTGVWLCKTQGEAELRLSVNSRYTGICAVAGNVSFQEHRGILFTNEPDMLIVKKVLRPSDILAPRINTR